MGKREFLCDYGNCNIRGDLFVVVSLNSGAERLRFCCERHASEYLRDRADRSERRAQAKDWPPTRP
jgi:hypothetical protein